MFSKKQLLDFAFQEALSSCNLGDATRETAIEVLATAMKGYSVRENVPFTDEEIMATIIAGIETMKEGSSKFFTAHYSKEDFLEIAFQEALNTCNTAGMSDELLVEVLTTGMNAYAVREGVPFTAEEVQAKIAAGMAAMKKDTSEFFTAHYSKEDLLEIAFQEASNTCRLAGMSEELIIEVLTTAMNGYAAREGVPFTAEEVQAKIAAGMAAMKKDTSEFFTANYSKEDLLEIAFQEALNTCRLTGMSEELIIEVLTTAINGYAVREGVPFTAEEVQAKIAAGLKDIKGGKSDYALFAEKTLF